MVKSGTVVAGPHTRIASVLRGTLGVRIGRATRTFGPGETIEVPPGTAHTLWNAGAEACVHRVEMMPALAMEDFFHEIVTIEAEGGIQAARLAMLMLRHRNQLAGLPWFIQRVVFGLLGLLSPRRARRASVDSVGPHSAVRRSPPGDGPARP